MATGLLLAARNHGVSFRAAPAYIVAAVVGRFFGWLTAKPILGRYFGTATPVAPPQAAVSAAAAAAVPTTRRPPATQATPEAGTFENSAAGGGGGRVKGDVTAGSAVPTVDVDAPKAELSSDDATWQAKMARKAKTLEGSGGSSSGQR